MTPDDPRHGRYAGAQAHWKSGVEICEPCRAAYARYHKGLDHDHAHGRRRRISATMATKHIARLREEGLTVPEIARRAGVAKATVYRASDSEAPPRMIASNVAAILSVTADTEPEQGYMPRVGVIRRIQALNAIGWTRVSLAARLEMSGPNLTQLVTGCRGATHRANLHVQVKTWQKIDALYRELSMTPGPSDESRRRALRNGWAPPMAWDDIDDPNEHPKGIGAPKGRSADDVDLIIVERLLLGDRIPSTRAEKFEAMRRWLASGRLERELCAMHGWGEARYVTREDVAS